MIWDGFNKRKFPRLKLRCEISIHPDTQPSLIQTFTENVGMGGVCVILDRPLERFGSCRVRLELNEKFLPIECRGKVVWTVGTREVHGRKEKYDTGIEFVDLDSSSTERLRQFLDGQVSVTGRKK